jgi:hypothetical protein
LLGNGQLKKLPISLGKILFTGDIGSEEEPTKEKKMKQMTMKPKSRRNVRRSALARAKRQMEFFPRNSRQWREAKQTVDFWS